jgi:hypothetical protein
MGSGHDNQELECFRLALQVRLAGLFQQPGDLGLGNRGVTERGGRDPIETPLPMST